MTDFKNLERILFKLFEKIKKHAEITLNIKFVS